MENTAIVAIKTKTSKYSLTEDGDSDCLEHCVTKLLNVKLINIPPNFFKDTTPERFKDEYEYDIADIVLKGAIKKGHHKCLCLNTDPWDIQTSASVKPVVTIDVSKPGKGQ